MSKKLPDVKAKPFGEAIESISPRLNKMLNITPQHSDNAQIFDIGPLNGRDDLIKILKTMVNSDVCLTDEREERLFIDMWEYLKNPDQTKLFAMVSVINSYRNECANCLNAGCRKRDPHFPLKETPRAR
jgi:hypothetical protein